MIKSGATARIVVKLNLTKAVDDVIFTLKSRGAKVQKTLTNDNNGVFLIDLNQAETESLVGSVQLEAQINYTDLSVAKTQIDSLYVNDTLATKKITDNAPTDADIDVILEQIKGDVALIISPESSQELIDAVTALFQATKQEADTVYEAYERGDLKGDKGDPGDQGEPGQDGYTPVRGTDYWTAEDVASMESDVERHMEGVFVPQTRKIANLALSEDITATQLSDKIATLAKTWQNLMQNNSGLPYLFSQVYSQYQINNFLAGKQDKPLATVEETPTNVYANVGDILEFKVISYTTTTLYYQWQVSTNGTTWSDISGATSATYQYTVVAGDYNKQFRCRISTDSAPNVVTGGYYMIKIAEYPVNDVKVNNVSVLQYGEANIDLTTYPQVWTGQATPPTNPFSGLKVGDFYFCFSDTFLGMYVCAEITTSVTWERVDNLVDDVQMNSTSVVSNGVADIPIATFDITSPASTGHLGVVKGRQALGTYIANDGAIAIYPSVATLVKTGTDNSRPLTSKLADATAFYGLAKVAGDTTQQNYAVDDAMYGMGYYTDDAKQAIQQMIGILSVQGVGF